MTFIAAVGLAAIGWFVGGFVPFPSANIILAVIGGIIGWNMKGK